MSPEPRRDGAPARRRRTAGRAREHPPAGIRGPRHAGSAARPPFQALGGTLVSRSPWTAGTGARSWSLRLIGDRARSRSRSRSGVRTWPRRTRGEDVQRGRGAWRMRACVLGRDDLPRRPGDGRPRQRGRASACGPPSRPSAFGAARRRWGSARRRLRRAGRSAPRLPQLVSGLQGHRFHLGPATGWSGGLVLAHRVLLFCCLKLRSGRPSGGQEIVYRLRGYAPPLIRLAWWAVSAAMARSCRPWFPSSHRVSWQWYPPWLRRPAQVTLGYPEGPPLSPSRPCSDPGQEAPPGQRCAGGLTPAPP
ncbi:hypothetical protein SAVIM40S_07728 [Streptomyces avidinii]|uniref:Uncharacterized protein n=1 Tax=Streptomyces avidinii TaxID=1895 RepID=A0ABS4KXW0_STRAV|nr:hypothetical protein [Streptomyces avidinii]